LYPSSCCPSTISLHLLFPVFLLLLPHLTSYSHQRCLSLSLCTTAQKFSKASRKHHQILGARMAT
jgi:hypothetical protein